MAQSDVTGAEHNIHKRNFVFYMFYPFVKTFFFLYYGKVEVNGSQHIPKGEPVIFAPNHQNALMDALIVLFTAPQDMVFLARADIFNKRFLTFMLNSFKILPVFRQRDGAAELAKNQEIFDISVDVLKKRHHLCVMPEGNHGSVRKLRAFGKGIFRIAFSAQKASENKPFVKIVPVGLDFGDYIKQNTSLYINFGEPIEMSEYWEQYEENNARAINAVKARLIDGMKPQMIHIGSDEYYEAVLGLREIFNPRMREIMEISGAKLSDRFKADKEMIARIDTAIGKENEVGEGAGRVSKLSGKVERYLEGVRSMNIREWVVRDKGYGFMRTLWRVLTLIITFPFFLYGFISNALPYFIPVRVVRNMKDRQFHSSVKAGLGILIFFPLFYLLQTILVGIFTGPWWIWAAYLVSLIPLGKAALYWYFRWKKTVRGSWFRGQLRRKKAAAVELVELREEILGLTEEIISN